MDECKNCSNCKHMDKLQDSYEGQCWYECEIIPYIGMIKSTDPFECECWEGVNDRIHEGIQKTKKKKLPSGYGKT